MKNGFLIVSKRAGAAECSSELVLIASPAAFNVYGRKKDFVVFDGVSVLLDGYVIPRLGIYHEYKNCEQHQLIDSLYKRFKSDCVKYLKGVYSIVILESQKVTILNDCLGIGKFYYTLGKPFSAISNSFLLQKKICGSDVVNLDFFRIKPLLNRSCGVDTPFVNIACSQPANKLICDENGIKVEQYWQHDSLLERRAGLESFEKLSQILKDNIFTDNQYLKANKTTISLTGGKDSRTGLAALMSNGVRPVGITYGDPYSKDGVFATLLAKKAAIDHEIFNQPRTAESFENTAIEIVEVSDPTINIHRGHRYYAFKKLNELLGPNTAFYAGYMAGELLMGIYYDDLIFTKFVTDSWSNGTPFSNIENLCKNCFIRTENIHFDSIRQKLSGLKTFDHSLNSKMREFHGLFEIGVLHHSQDLRLAMHFFDFVIPFFLDIDFLEALFSSRFSFFYCDNKTKNLLKRYRLYQFNLKAQHKLWPEFDTIPFGKRGSYNTVEFLKGPFYWSLIKTIRYFRESKMYPVTFCYDEAYRQFLNKWFRRIISDSHTPINDIYDLKKARNSFESIRMPASEKELMPYSNIVMHYLQLRRYTLDGI